jgi:16S rRNA (adenine1518-N6/adenine1519-N6)-dimethyltransferase
MFIIVYADKSKMSKLGQHFMIDEKVLQRVVDAAKLEEGERILEVGPGKGALTKLLAEKCSVTAIERDKGFYRSLREGFPGIEIIRGNALKIGWPVFDKCVSNLPYLISKKFVLKLLQHDFKLSVLVLQKEFAEKLAAEPGERNYGTVSVCAHAGCKVELLDTIPKNAFKPQPKVESRMVRLTQKKKLDKDFIDFVTLRFQHRNKKLGDKRVRDFSPKEFLSLYYDNQ